MDAGMQKCLPARSMAQETPIKARGMATIMVKGWPKERKEDEQRVELIKVSGNHGYNQHATSTKKNTEQFEACPVFFF